jgi:hypothetical protein
VQLYNQNVTVFDNREVFGLRKEERFYQVKGDLLSCHESSDYSYCCLIVSQSFVKRMVELTCSIQLGLEFQHAARVLFFPLSLGNTTTRSTLYV